MRFVRGLLGACLMLLIAASPARAAKDVDGVINLNTAEIGVLALLPGIGPAKAAQIAAYRKRRPFRTVDELVRIPGIGRKMVRHLRAHLAVSGPTTATGTIKPAAVIPPPPPPPPSPPPTRPPPPRALCARPGPPQRPKRERPPTHSVCPAAR
jgi:competence protein ComEA